jgi:hypothetical protein
MRVDHKRRVLWANVFSESSKETGIFKFNLKTGQVLRKHLVPQKTGNHIFSDVTVLADGSVYITGIATSFIDKWKKKLPVVDPVLIMKVKIKFQP